MSEYLYLTLASCHNIKFKTTLGAYMRLPHGMVKQLATQLGVSTVYMCSLIAKRDQCSPNRAIELERICKELGYEVPKELWVFGTCNQIKNALLSSRLNKSN